MALQKYLSGPLTRFGMVIAVLTAAADQALKVWLLRGFDLAAHGLVRLGPFIDLVLVWNPGISYGLFPQVGPLG
jgi:signal peptidase II